MTERIREKISVSENTKAEKDKRRIDAEERLTRLDKKTTRWGFYNEEFTNIVTNSLSNCEI